MSFSRTWAGACWSPAWARRSPRTWAWPRPPWPATGAERLTFGPMEPLVALMQETPADRLLPAVVERMKAGDRPPPTGGGRCPGQRPHASAARITMATTRSWPWLPSYQMSRELPEAQRALPVLKVLYRNTSHIQQMGGPEPRGPPSRRAGRLVRGPAGAGSPARGDAPAGHGRRPSGRLPRMARGPLDEAYNDLQYVVQDYIDVHRVVLAWRSWALLDFTGKEHAHTLLRQSVRFCVDEETTSIATRTTRGDAAGAPARSCSIAMAWRAARPGTAGRTTPGSSG